MIKEQENLKKHQTMKTNRLNNLLQISSTKEKNNTMNVTSDKTYVTCICMWNESQEA